MHHQIISAFRSSGRFEESGTHSRLITLPPETICEAGLKEGRK